jgi:hypothetical protein
MAMSFAWPASGHGQTCCSGVPKAKAYGDKPPLEIGCSIRIHIKASAGFQYLGWRLGSSILDGNPAGFQYLGWNPGWVPLFVMGPKPGFSI